MTDIVERLNDSLSAGYDSLSAGYSELRKEAAEEIMRLRAKIAEMEKQRSAAWCATDETGTVVEALGMNQSRRFDTALYLAPGAQPAPSGPEGWLRAIDEALVIAHVGIADESDTYEQAKAKLDNLIGLHVDIATDPAVNGGYKLVPIEPTPEMIRALIDGANQYASWNEGYRDMLAAAPKAKS